MKQFFRHNGGLLLIAAALLAAVLAIGAQILGFDPFTSALEVLATPFRAASAAVANWTQAQYDRAFRYDELAVENEALRRQVAQLEQRIDDMTADFRRDQLSRMREGACSDEACILYSELLTDFERIGDHVLNIAEELTKARTTL